MQLFFILVQPLSDEFLRFSLKISSLGVRRLCVNRALRSFRCSPAPTAGTGPLQKLPTTGSEGLDLSLARMDGNKSNWTMPYRRWWRKAKKKGGEWSEGNDHRRVRARFIPCFSLSPNKSPATQASVSHFQIGDWGRWKEKIVFLFLSRIPPSFSSFARVLVDFQKKKKKTSVCRPRMFQCPNS